MTELDCKTCGACCTDQLILVRDDDHVPFMMVDGCLMRKQGGRCTALRGRVGIDPRCSIYADRPMICRVFKAGSPQCWETREAHGLGRAHSISG